MQVVYCSRASVLSLKSVIPGRATPDYDPGLPGMAVKLCEIV
jgi:hypothetical protein